MNRSPADVKSLCEVAMGQRDADLLLKNCSLVSVYTGEIIPDIMVAVYGGRIAYVGPDGRHAAGRKTRVMDAAGRFVCPGLADAHIHMDQFVLPSEFVKKSLLCGVTTLFSESIDVVSVAGNRGFQEFQRLCRGLPARIFHVIPGGTPVDPGFSSSKRLSLAQERAALRQPDVLGMGEIFSWTRITGRDPDTMKSISAVLEGGHIINGHTAGAKDRNLNAYVSPGVLSCHEPINFAESLHRLRLGMRIMMREGAVRRDLADIIPGMLKAGMDRDMLMFCTDGLSPEDLSEYGHIDHCIREAVRLGVKPIDAITMGTRNCIEYYGMGRDLGGIAPGRLADMIIFDDLDDMRPDKVFVGGKLVASAGRLVPRIPKRRVPAWLKDTVRRRFAPRDFAVPADRQMVQANTIFMVNEIITRQGSAVLYTRDGLVNLEPDDHIWKVAALDRSGRTRAGTVGFLENFAAGIGAFASTWSYHENDMIVVGRTDADMAAVANDLAVRHGGMSISRDGRILASLGLPVAGILSDRPFNSVMSEFEGLNSCMASAGCSFARPHLMMLFLTFLAIPSVRIVSGGLIDVRQGRRIPVLK